MEFTYVREMVTEEEQAKWMRRRHKRDEVPRLPQGFSFKANGRQGFIYYREGDRVLELYWEMSGTSESDILLNVFGLRRWVWPSTADVAEPDRNRIRQDLEVWLGKAGYRSVFSEVAY